MTRSGLSISWAWASTGSDKVMRSCVSSPSTSVATAAATMLVVGLGETSGPVLGAQIPSSRGGERR